VPCQTPENVTATAGRTSGRWVGDWLRQHLTTLRSWMIVPVAGAQLALATAVASRPALALVAVGGGAALATALVLPVVVLVSAFPATYAYWRVGPGAVDMSGADAITYLGLVAAAPFVPWRNRTLQLVLAAAAAYGVVLAASVIPSPSERAVVEVAHRTLLIAGPICIGAALGPLRHITSAVRAFLIASVVVATATVLTSVANGFAPPYPFGMHKNAVGSLLATALLLLVIAPGRLRWRRNTLVVVGSVLGVGMLASQSRGASIALVITFSLWSWRESRAPARASGKRRGVAGQAARLAPLLLLVSVGLMAVTFLTYAESDLSEETAQFNSLNSRLETYDYAIEEVWKPNIVFGGGLRWFTDPASLAGVPHNLLIAEASETGILGLLALGGLLVVLGRGLGRLRSDIGDAALFILVQRLLDALLGILWVAGTGTAVFLMIGLALGDAAVFAQQRTGNDRRAATEGGRLSAAAR